MSLKYTLLCHKLLNAFPSVWKNSFLQFLLKYFSWGKRKKDTRNTSIHLGHHTFIHFNRITVVHVHVNILSNMHTACHNDANAIRAESYSNVTDKHAAECSNTAYLGVNLSVCDV